MARYSHVLLVCGSGGEHGFRLARGERCRGHFDLTVHPLLCALVDLSNPSPFLLLRWRVDAWAQPCRNRTCVSESAGDVSSCAGPVGLPKTQSTAARASLTSLQMGKTIYEKKEIIKGVRCGCVQKIFLNRCFSLILVLPMCSRFKRDLRSMFLCYVLVMLTLLAGLTSRTPSSSSRQT